MLYLAESAASQVRHVPGDQICQRDIEHLSECEQCAQSRVGRVAGS